MMEPDEKLEKTIAYYNDKKFELSQFLSGINTFFNEHPVLSKGEVQIIHSVKSRFKDDSHLKDKIQRKEEKGDSIDESNLFEKVNDLIGVRVLHLYSHQFISIHEEILKKALLKTLKHILGIQSTLPHTKN